MASLLPPAPTPDLVVLDRDHPGFRDPVYRARRNEIARMAEAYIPGTKLPRIEYSPVETSVWGTALEHLRPLHEKYACPEYLSAWISVGFVPGEIPSLESLARTLSKTSGFRLEPVAGLMSPRYFMDRLADDVFLSTQYVRHHSAPLYTPEPDVLHEFIGHVPLLYDTRLAELNRLFGRATRRATTEEELERLIRVYWYTLEFGVLGTRGHYKVHGAGLLSSYGELGRFETNADLRPFDVEAIAETPFDPTNYQNILFVAKDLDEVERELVHHLG